MLYSFLVLADGKEAYPLIIHLKSVQVFPYIVALAADYKIAVGCMLVVDYRVAADCMPGAAHRGMADCMPGAAHRGMADRMPGAASDCMLVTACMVVSHRRRALVPGNFHCCRERHRELCGIVLVHVLLSWGGRSFSARSSQ